MNQASVADNITFIGSKHSQIYRYMYVVEDRAITFGATVQRTLVYVFETIPDNDLSIMMCYIMTVTI